MADPIPPKTNINPEILALMGALNAANNAAIVSNAPIALPSSFFSRMAALNQRMAALEDTPEFRAEIVALTLEIQNWTPNV